MSKTFELIRPKSLQDSVYADYEYLLRWIGRDGSDYLYMFYDAEFSQQVNVDIINQESETRIESLITSETRSITLKAEDLAKADLEIILELFSNKYITRLKKNGTTERYAPDRNSKTWRLMGGRYELEFKLILSDLPIWN
jgi:hypothetical protein